MPHSDVDQDMQLYQLVYCSSARVPSFPQKELVNILHTCRRVNSSYEVKITGLLMYKDGQFVQFLEGRKEDVLSLYQKISEDPRHFNCTIVFEREMKGRDFGNWSMSFRDLERMNRGLPKDPQNLPHDTEDNLEDQAFNQIMIQTHTFAPQFSKTMDQTIKSLIDLYHKLFLRI